MEQSEKAPPRRRRTSAARGPGERAGLTRAEILASAWTIAEQDGLEQVSIRRIAGQLGVAPNALYTYFTDKTALLDALFDAIVGEIELSEMEGRPWQEQLAELMRASRRLVLRHPQLATLFLTRQGGPNALRLGELTLRVLAEGGLGRTKAVAALRALLTYTLGFAAMEVSRLSDPDRTARMQRASELITKLDPETYTTTRALVADVARHPGDEDFEAGLRWLIRGIESESVDGRSVG